MHSLAGDHQQGFDDDRQALLLQKASICVYVARKYRSGERDEDRDSGWWQS